MLVSCHDLPPIWKEKRCGSFFLFHNRSYQQALGLNQSEEMIQLCSRLFQNHVVLPVSQIIRLIELYKCFFYLNTFLVCFYVQNQVIVQLNKWISNVSISDLKNKKGVPESCNKAPGWLHYCPIATRKTWWDTSNKNVFCKHAYASLYVSSIINPLFFIFCFIIW